MSEEKIRMDTDINKEYLTELKCELLAMLGKDVLVFLDNNFRYSGELIKAEDYFITIADKKSGMNQLIRIDKIAEVKYA